MTTEWWHYVMVYGAWIVLGLVAVGGIFVSPFRRNGRRRR